MSDQVTIQINGRPRQVARGTLLAVALAVAGHARFRRSATGEPRAPFCGMGVCFECGVTVNGRAHERSCQLACEAGMEVRLEE